MYGHPSAINAVAFILIVRADEPSRIVQILSVDLFEPYPLTSKPECSTAQSPCAAAHLPKTSHLEDIHGLHADLSQHQSNASYGFFFHAIPLAQHTFLAMVALVSHGTAVSAPKSGPEAIGYASACRFAMM